MSDDEIIKKFMVDIFSSFTAEEQDIILKYHIKVAEVYGSYKTIVRIFDDREARE